MEMLQGGMESSNWVAIAVIFASTCLNAAYFLPIVYRAFFREPPAPSRRLAGGQLEPAGELAEGRAAPDAVQRRVGQVVVGADDLCAAAGDGVAPAAR